MSWLWRRGDGDLGEPAVDTGRERDWEGPSPGARALVTSGVRVAAWGLVLAGPVLAVAALASGPSQAVSPNQGSGRVVEIHDGGPAGFAELFVSSYLDAGSGEDLEAFYPGAEPSGGGSGRAVEHVASVDTEEIGDGLWSVTVAARVTENGLGGEDQEGEADPLGLVRYFHVPVSAGDGGWVAAGYPAEVAAPGGTERPDLGFVPVDVAPSDPAVVTVSGFLDAYLTGGSEVDRYLAPGAETGAVTPAPYVRVDVGEVAVRPGLRAGDEGELPVPESGRLEVLVEVEGRLAGGGVRPLSYAVVLAERDGRWEVAELAAAGALAGDAA